MDIDTAPVTKLRAIYQGMGGDATKMFSMDDVALRQWIKTKQVDIVPKPPLTVERNPYDVRLMNKSPAKRTDRKLVEEIAEPFVKMGMHLRFDEERWYISHSIKTDEGPLRMPLRTILGCFEKLMNVKPAQ